MEKFENHSDAEKKAEGFKSEYEVENIALAEQSFGQFLRCLIKESPYTYKQFYEQLGIKRSYLNDILRRRTNPPPAYLQFKIADILELDAGIKSEFFELAAKERGEFPADLSQYLDLEKRNQIRSSQGFTESFKAF